MRGGDTKAPQAPLGSKEAVSPFYSPTAVGWVRETPCGSFEQDKASTDSHHPPQVLGLSLEQPPRWLQL